MARISIRVEGLEEVNRLFARLKHAGRLAPALRDMGEHLLNTTRERFNTQAAPDGAPWAPLKPQTVRRKKKNADKILTEQGELRGSLSYHVGFFSDELLVGSPEKYAATHQFGAPSRNIPARPFLGLSAADRAAIERIARDHLAKALRG